MYGVHRYLGLGKLRVRLGLGEESVVRFVFVDDLPLDDDDHRGDGHHQEDQQDEDDDVGVPGRAILAEIIQA